MLPGRRMMSIQAQVGGRRRQKGSRMMRKITLILLGAATGAAMTLIASQPHMTFAVTSAKAAVADTYRQLNLFGDVFERVRADYVEVPDDDKLIESAINGMLTGLDPHSSYMRRGSGGGDDAVRYRTADLIANQRQGGRG